MNYTYIPKGVCPMAITFDINGDVVTNINFTGGCNGNLKAIAKILDGRKVDEIEEMLAGNTCGKRQTSCADQLAKAVREAQEKELATN